MEVAAAARALGESARRGAAKLVLADAVDLLAARAVGVRRARAFLRGCFDGPAEHS
jgi:hypothetical protein